MDRKISIIVPVYNLENYLERCVRSLLEQTYRNIEIILIDDGSTDGSAGLCDKLKKEDGRITCIHKKNGGLSSARNCGLDIAKGECVTFVDGDDCVHPRMLQVMNEEMLRHNVKLGICDYQHFCKEEEITDPDTGLKDELLDTDQILNKLYLPERPRFVMACCKLIDKKLLEGIRFPAGRYREDEFTTYKLLLKAGNVLYIHQKYYFYYQREESIMHSFQVKRETDYYDALLERHEYLKQMGCSWEQLEQDTLFCIKQLYNSIFLWNGMKDEERKKYQKAYVKMYDSYYQGKHMGKMADGRYLTARYMPKLLYGMWQIKKRIEGAVSGK